MSKIKPLTKMHPFRRWIKRLLRIKSPSGPTSWKELDEMHEYSDPALIGALKSGMAPVIYRRQTHARWVEGDYGETLKLACSSCGAPFEYRTTFCPDCGARMDEEGGIL